MKKIFKTIIFVLVAAIAVPVFMAKPVTVGEANAATPASPIISASDFETNVNGILTDFSVYKDRTPGSVGEKTASEYIRNYLVDNTELQAVTTKHFENGIQSFQFESSNAGGYINSQNIIFRLAATTETTKKVIIGCHYDAVAYDMDITSENYGKFVDSESLNGSAGNVAVLLSLAKYLPAQKDFAVEFVFFGAGEDNKAGSKYYTQGISKDDKKNIVCMININQVAVGQNLYFYMNEVDTKTADFVETTTYNSRVGIERVSVSHLNKMLLSEPNELGLDYTHVGLDSDNINFMSEGIETINIFAGNYSEGIIIGRQEFYDYELLTYTANDNLAYVNETFPDFSVAANLYEAFKAVTTILSADSFIATFEAAKGSTNFFYKVFTNKNLVLYLTAIVFVLFVIIAMYVYYKLSIKAYYANVEVEFLSSVVKISDELDKTGKDDSVAKVVSQVIANDIKKDKVIKVKPSKDDKKDENDKK